MKRDREYGLLEPFLSKKRCQMANKLLPAGLKIRRILDIGCGSYPRFLLAANADEKHGLDKLIRRQHIERYAAHNIVLSRVDVECVKSLMFENAYFDAITMLAVFEHIRPRNLAKLTSEIYRVLRPGGVFVLTTPAFWTEPVLKVMSMLRLVSADQIDEHKEIYNHRTIRSILVCNGFNNANIQCGQFELGMNTWVSASRTIYQGRLICHQYAQDHRQ